MSERKFQYVTLLWNEIPESIRVFVIPRDAITKDDVRMLKACHGFYVNDGRVDDSATAAYLNRLSVLLVDPEKDWTDERWRTNVSEELQISRQELDALVGKWHGFEIDIEKPHTLPRSRFYSSGFIM